MENCGHYLRGVHAAGLVLIETLSDLPDCYCCCSVLLLCWTTYC